MGRLGSGDILQRGKAFALRVISLIESPSAEEATRPLMLRSLRRAIAVVASLRRADMADSAEDFLDGMDAAEQMAFESGYWLSLIRDAEVPIDVLRAAETEAESLRKACRRIAHPCLREAC